MANKKTGNPYEGEQARGWSDYHAGIPRAANPYLNIGNDGHRLRWDEGWKKAKMAKEQGKRAMRRRYHGYREER